MAEIQLSIGSTVALPKAALEKLLDNLVQMGYRVFGPQIQDGAIVYKSLNNITELPKGYISEQDAASYRLVYSGHRRYFDVTPGAQSWKQFFFPPFSELANYKRDDHGRWQVEETEVDLTPLALFGVFPCDLAAIQVQDRIFLREEWKDPDLLDSPPECVYPGSKLPASLRNRFLCFYGHWPKSQPGV